jgi:hypothetical protein
VSWRWLWKPIDAIGMWFIEELDALVQLRIGVLLSLISVPFYPYLFWSGEPPVIYFLSVLATTLGGLGFLIGAQVLFFQQKSDPDRPDPGES